MGAVEAEFKISVTIINNKLQGDVSQRRGHFALAQSDHPLSTNLEKRKQEKIYRRIKQGWRIIKENKLHLLLKGQGWKYRINGTDSFEKTDADR